MAKSHSIAQAKYDSTHCKYYTLKMNLVNDSDVIARLAEQDSMQGYIKELIRADMKTPVPVSKRKLSVNKLIDFLTGQAEQRNVSLYDLLNEITDKYLNG